MTRVLVVGDVPGVPDLLRHLPVESVAGIMGASIRPQYLDDLERLATSVGVPFVVQPRPKDPAYGDFVARIRALAPDLIVVNSYSMILREDLIACAPRGAVNVHGALLPKNRGPNPIQWAILWRQHETGVTLHRVTAGLDEGPIIAQRRVPILFWDTWADVRARIDAATEEMLASSLPSLLRDGLPETPQDARMATVGRRRTPDDGLFEWSAPLRHIHDLVRAVVPPLPPAFYRDAAGQRQEMLRRYMVGELAAMKWGSVGGQRLQNAGIAFVPLTGEPAADRVAFAAVDRESDTSLGAVRFGPISADGSHADVGFPICPGAHRTEDAYTQMLRLALEVAFDELALDRVACSVSEPDEAFQRAAAALGGLMHPGSADTTVRFTYSNRVHA